jgi:hypothetical protein
MENPCSETHCLANLSQTLNNQPNKQRQQLIKCSVDWLPKGHDMKHIVTTPSKTTHVSTAKQFLKGTPTSWDIRIQIEQTNETDFSASHAMTFITSTTRPNRSGN